MSDTAFQVQYRQETIDAFEQQRSIVRDSVTTEAVVKGNQATFLVAGSGGASAVTRGVNGLIPARPDDLTQYTATLSEWHDLVRKSRFNIFASQGDQRAVMQRTTLAVINRKIDSDIITELNTATVNTGVAVTASVSLALKAQTILGNSDVPFDGNVWALMTPAFRAYLMQTTEFANADYVTRKPYDGSSTMWRDMTGFYRWMEVNWIVHPNLPGAGSSAEKCFMYHRSSIGHAADIAGLNTDVGYNGEQDYSYARASMFMGPQILQNSGIVVINHDGSQLVAA